MGFVIVLWLALHPTTQERARLAAWAQGDLTTEAAERHLVAARVASVAVHLPTQQAYLLLYIARHESHFRQDVRTPEPQGKTSCGVMTPVPLRRCRAGRTLLDQYIAGATHLREWYRACDGRDLCALLGYAGGFALIRTCRSEHRMWRKRGARRVDLCDTGRLYRDGALDLQRVVESE